MKWSVLETVISPETGMSFSLVTSPNGNRFALWHVYNPHIKPGQDLYIHAGNAWVYSGEHMARVQIYRADIFSSNLWENIKKHAGCDTYLVDDGCTFKTWCVISSCPHRRR